jgi:hypothetical protein
MASLFNLEVQKRMLEEIHLMKLLDHDNTIRYFGSYLKGSKLWVHPLFLFRSLALPLCFSNGIYTSPFCMRARVNFADT